MASLNFEVSAVSLGCSSRGCWDMTKARTGRASGVASHATPGFGLIGRIALRLDLFIDLVALRSGFGLVRQILVRPPHDDSANPPRELSVVVENRLLLQHLHHDPAVVAVHRVLRGRHCL